MVPTSPDDWDDSRLLISWREGNVAAGRELFARHYDTIYRFFDSKIKKDIQALVEGTFRDSIGELQGPGDVRVSLFAFATHRLYAHFKVERALEHTARMDPSSLSLQELGGHPSTMIQTGPGLALIREAIPRIPLGEQLLLELYLNEEPFTVSEVADILEIDPGSVAARLEAAQHHLDRELRVLDSDDARVAATRSAFRRKLLEAQRRRGVGIDGRTE